MAGILDFSIFHKIALAILMIDALFLFFALSWVVYFSRKERRL